MQEAKRSHSAHFITLTYDTKHVPITKNGFMELRKRDIQLFFKRLRKRLPGVAIKYYCAAEYSPKPKDRPHYHVIIYNVELSEVQPAWALGHIHYGKLSEASVGYTLKYICKTRRIPAHRNDDRQPEFSLMSKGLGDNYINAKTTKWHLNGERMYCVIEDGKKISMPRYYKDKIFSEENRVLIGKKAALVIREKNQKARVAGGKNFFRNKQEAVDMAYREMAIDANKRNKSS